jgi:hypothetical protein
MELVEGQVILEDLVSVSDSCRRPGYFQNFSVGQVVL